MDKWIVCIGFCNSISRRITNKPALEFGFEGVTIEIELIGELWDVMACVRLTRKEEGIVEKFWDKSNQPTTKA